MAAACSALRLNESAGYPVLWLVSYVVSYVVSCACSLVALVFYLQVNTGSRLGSDVNANVK